MAIIGVYYGPSLSGNIGDNEMIGEINNANRMLACNGVPTSYSNALVRELGRVTINSGDFLTTGYNSLNNKVIVSNQKITMDAEGDFTHLVLINTTFSRLYIAVEVDPHAYVYPGQSYDLPPFDIRFNTFVEEA